MEELNKREKELFISYGSAASEAMFDFPCHFFQIPTSTGFIAYRIQFTCAIILGDPICQVDERMALMQAFHQYCNKLNMRIVYISVSATYAKMLQKDCKVLMEVCEEIFFDPQINPLIANHRLEHRFNKAIQHGLTFHEYIPLNQEIENSLLEIGVKWNKAIKGSHVYIGHLNFFESYIGKRWFYVKDGTQIISMIMLSKLEAQGGWYLKFLITLPKVFRETSEFAMVSLLKTLRNENCRFLTKGMIPLDCMGEIKGLSFFSNQFINYIYKIIGFIFKFKKRKAYWQRYHPKSVPTYLAFSNSKIGLNEIRALMNVFKMKL